MARITGAAGQARLADCDLVIEAVFEDLELKRAVLARLAAICRPEAVLAPNASCLDPPVSLTPPSPRACPLPAASSGCISSALRR